jgi:transglutaminase-like putative cysteine protease
MEALRPYTRGTGHSDMNGEGLPAAITELCRRVTFYREPAGMEYAGEVVQSPTLTLAINGGDCDDIATLAATCGKVFGCNAAIGWYATGSGANAHIVAAIESGWYRPTGTWTVIDPQNQKEPASALAGAHWLGV